MSQQRDFENRQSKRVENQRSRCFHFPHLHTDLGTGDTYSRTEQIHTPSAEVKGVHEIQHRQGIQRMDELGFIL